MSAARVGPRDIVVVGASAGGVEALTRFVSALSDDLPAAVFIVLHVSPSGSILPSILARHTRLDVAHAQDGSPIEPGRIYVAPPNRHLLIEEGDVRVTAGPRQNGHRPAIDPLFRSAARAYGPRVAAVLLSGALDDGVVGCTSVVSRGGITLVQDPREATYPSMPLNAIDFDSPTHVAKAGELGRLIVELATTVSENRESPAPAGVEAMDDVLHEDGEQRINGRLSPFTCPECHGTLWEVEEAGLVRFRCRVGHAYNMGAMDAAQGTALEAVLWTTLRSLEERAALKRRLAERTRGRSVRMRHRYEHDAAAAEEHAAVVRRLLDEIAAPATADEPIVGGVE